MMKKTSTTTEPDYQILVETTKWNSVDVPNHVYLVAGNYAYAYIKKDTVEPIYFNKRMEFNKRGREFYRLRISPFDLTKVCTV